MYALPPAREMFADADTPGEITSRYDAFKSSMADVTKRAVAGEWVHGSHDGSGRVIRSRDEAAFGPGSSKRAQLEALIADAEVTKGVSPDVLSALNTQLQASADVTKEWTLTTPLSTGLVPFDLEAPAKLLAPRPTPWRNMFPRIKGFGTSHRHKSITGFSGSGSGGVGTINPGISESTTNTFAGGQSWLRGPQISYAAVDVILSYVQSSLSDQVSWAAEYQGQGFEDIRSLSNTVLLYASMLAEERLLVYGRGTTGNGYTGALAAPSGASLAAVTAPSGYTALSSGTYWVVITADAGSLGANHESAATTAASVSISTGQAIQVTVGTDSAGALGYNLYCASVQAGPYYYQGRTGYNVGVIGGAAGGSSLGTGTALITSGAADTSAQAVNYDGVLTNLAANGGYVKRLNSTLSTVTPGTEFQSAFASLYDAVKADPDAIWMNGFDRKQLSNALLSASQANPSNYRIMLQRDDQTGTMVGTLVSHIVNEVTGKDVEINVHPWIPQGNATVQSYTLPMPDSNVTNTWAVVCPQDYVAVQWPVTDFVYSASSYWISCLESYAPGFSGIIQGITAA